MIMRRIIYIVLIGLITVLFPGCKTVTKIRQDSNLAYIYNPGKATIHPRYKVYHDNDNQSTLFVKIYPVELLFNIANPEGIYRAELGIYYRLYDLTVGRIVVDSGFVKYPVLMHNVKREFIAGIPIKAEKEHTYNLEVIVRDIFRNKAVQSFITVDKTSEYNRQNFIVVDFKTRVQIFNPVVDSSLALCILYPGKEIDTLYIKYFKDKSKIPDPPSFLIPSGSMDLDPDSVWSIPYSDTSILKFPVHGIYQVGISPDRLEGYSFTYFGEYFPSVKTPEEMIKPLVYLASRNEINRLLNDPDPKLAVDNFWLESASDIERARELIRIYYNRVLYANYFFASYKEGWKTDRGMIYIVYGPPDEVFKNDEEEKWIFGTKKSSPRISFTFTKVNNPFTQNDFKLRRNAETNTMWDQAVTSWRNGNTFEINQIKE